MNAPRIEPCTDTDDVLVFLGEKAHFSSMDVDYSPTKAGYGPAARAAARAQHTPSSKL